MNYSSESIGVTMDIAKFEASPVGTLVSISGSDAYLRRGYKHVAFCPSPLPHEMQLSLRTHKLLGEAERGVGRLDASVKQLPNPALLVRPTLYREAVATSALEGTYAPLAEVFEADLLEDRQRSHEVREILNYVAASERGLLLIETRPICASLVSELQAILVRGTRGDGFDAGRIRTGQVYIGERGLGIESSRFVPPPAGQILIEGVSEWEKWINEDDDLPLVAKVALAHYQFETLHPFSDGNGRLGRLIVVLQFMTAGALAFPVLNLSPWLEARKDSYKDHMLAVSASGNFDPWVAFFAEAVIAQADDAVRRITRIMQIRQRMLDDLKAERARGVVLDIVDDLVAFPIITPSRAASLHGVTYPPANNAIERLVRLGHLREITGGSYGRVFASDALMLAVEGHLDESS